MKPILFIATSKNLSYKTKTSSTVAREYCQKGTKKDQSSMNYFDPEQTCQLDVKHEIAETNRSLENL